MAADRATGEERARTAKMSRDPDSSRRTALLPRIDMETVNTRGSEVKDYRASHSFDPLCGLWHRRSPVVGSSGLFGGHSSASRPRDVAVQRSGKRRRLVSALGKVLCVEVKRGMTSTAANQGEGKIERDETTWLSGRPGLSTFGFVCKLQPDFATGGDLGKVCLDWPSSHTDSPQSDQDGEQQTTGQETANGWEWNARRKASRRTFSKPRHVRRLFDSLGLANATINGGNPPGESASSRFGRLATSTTVASHERLSSAITEPYPRSRTEVFSSQDQPDISSAVNLPEVNAELQKPMVVTDTTVSGSPALSGVFSTSPVGMLRFLDGCEESLYFSPSPDQLGISDGLGTPCESLTRRQELNEATPQEHFNKESTRIIRPAALSKTGGTRFPEPCFSNIDRELNCPDRHHDSPSSPASETLSVPLKDLKLKDGTDQTLSQQLLSKNRKRAWNSMTFGLQSLIHRRQGFTETQTSLPKSDGNTTTDTSGPGALPHVPSSSLLGKPSDDETEEALPCVPRLWCGETPVEPPPAPKKRRPFRQPTFRREGLAAGYIFPLRMRSRNGKECIEAAKKRLHFDTKRLHLCGSSNSEAHTKWPSTFPLPSTMGRHSVDVLKDILPSAPVSLPLSPTKAKTVSPSQSLTLNLLSYNARRQAVRRLKKSLGEAFHQSLAELLTPLNACRFSQMYRMPLSQAVGHLCGVMVQDVAARVLELEGEDLKREITASFLKDVRTSLLETTGHGGKETALDISGLMQQSLGEAGKCGLVRETLFQQDLGEASPGTHARARRSSLLLGLYVISDVTNHCTVPAFGAAAVAEVTRLSKTKLGALWREAITPPMNEVWQAFLLRLQHETRCGKCVRTASSGSDSSERRSGVRVDSQALGSSHGGEQDQGLLSVPAFIAKHQRRPLAEAWRCMTGLDWEGQGRRCWESVHMDKVRDGCLHPWRETAREVVLFLSLAT